jgi:hypothetical protein
MITGKNKMNLKTLYKFSIFIFLFNIKNLPSQRFNWVKNHWMLTVDSGVGILEAYLKEDGKPVVAIWVCIKSNWSKWFLIHLRFVTDKIT